MFKRNCRYYDLTGCIFYFIMYSLTAMMIALVVWLGVSLFQHTTGIKEGVVYKKDYDLPSTTFILCGKVMVPQHHAERYTLYFKDDSGDKNYVNVDETTYHQYDVGDYWDGE